jgi:hypothetical protein
MNILLTLTPGWIFYSAVNSVVPQIVLNLGFADDSWQISIRQLVRLSPSCSMPILICLRLTLSQSYQGVILMAPLLISLWATRYKDMKTPLVVTFIMFFVV